MVALATAFVRVRPDVSAREFTAEVEGAIRSSGGETAAKRKGRSIGEAFSKGFGDGSSTLGRVASVMAARMTIATAAVSAATPAIAQFVAAVAPAAGVGAALPAVLSSIAVTSTATKVAVLGVGQAISSGFGTNAKRAAEDLKGLSGQARTFATQVIGLRGPLTDIQRATANSFFKPLNDEIQPLTQTYLPLLRAQLPQTSAGVGGLAEAFLRVARTAPVVRAVNSVFDATQGALVRVRAAVAPVVTAIANGMASTVPAIGMAANGFTNLAIKTAAWINEGAKTGRFMQWIRDGVTTVRLLVQIFADLGAITSSVFGAATTNSGTLLERIRALTGQVRAFVESARGSQVIADLFRTMGVFGAALRTALAGVLPQIAAALQVSAPAAGQFAQAIARLVVALGPLLPALAAAAAVMVRALVPAMNALSGWLERNEGLVRALAPAILAYVVAAKAMAVVIGVKAVALRAWAITLGVAKVAQAGWTAVTWLAAAPVHAHTAALRLSQTTIGTWIGVKALEARAWLGSTASVVGHRLALIASTVATKANAAVTVVWAAVTRAATVGMAAARVAMLALNTAMRANPIGAVITLISLLVAAFVYLYRNNETARRIMDAAWKGIQTAIRTVVDWFRNTAWPWIKRVIDWIIAYYRALWTAIQVVFRGIMAVIRGFQTFFVGIGVAIRAVITVVTTAFRTWQTVTVTIWRTVGAGIAAVWNSIRTGSFTPLRSFILNTLPGAFRTGVTAITNAWNKVKAAAREPVRFVVTQVINPLIRGYNAIAGVFNTPKANEIKGFERGGRIPGTASRRDNMLATMVDGQTGRTLAPMKVATGEYIVNSESTSKWLPVLEAINNRRNKAPDWARSIRGVDPVRDGAAHGGHVHGYAEGGLVGWIKGMAGKGAAALNNVFKAVTDPVGSFEKLANTAIRAIPGGGGLRRLLVGGANTILDKVIAKIQGLQTSGFLGVGGIGGNASPGFPPWPSSPGAQRGNSGVWRNIVAMIKSTGPASGSFGNAYRPGDPKWHGSGRAVDWMGYNQDALATFLASRRPLELIHRTNQRDYAYTRGVNKGSFNRSLMEAHRNHIHIAMRFGGLVEKLSGMVNGGLLRRPLAAEPVRLLDRGGAWPSGTVGVNRSGHTEHVLTGGPSGDVAELKEILSAILAAVQGLGGDVADAIGSNTRRAVQIGRGRGITVTGRATT
jgi:hypothetical protein